MKLSIIIPVYNEESTIGLVLDQIDEVDLGEIQKEIIIVDDGSTDNTLAVIREHDGQVTFVHASPVNFGKGAAIRIGLTYAQGEIILIQDADLELNPAEYPKLLAPVIKGKTEVVYGSRFTESWWVPGMAINSIVANRVLVWTVNILFDTHITDEATAYKIFTKHVAQSISLRCIGFEFCPEFTAKVLREGFSIYEVPIGYNPRSTLDGKKVKWNDGIIALYTLIKYRFWKIERTYD